MDPQTCTHQQQTTSGSDQHQKIIQCTQCHKVLFVYHREARAHLVHEHMNAWGALALNPTSGVNPSTEPVMMELQEWQAHLEQDKRAMRGKLRQMARQLTTMRERMKKAMGDLDGVMTDHRNLCEALRS